MKERVVVAPGSSSTGAMPNPEAAWSLLFGLGFVLVVVGAIDQGLLFIPARWASLDWEFGTISAAVQGMPLPTVGIGLMVVSAVARGNRGWMRALSILMFLIAVVVALSVVIFALDVPVAMRAVSGAGREPLLKAIAKTGSMAAIYVLWFAVLAIWTWRQLRVSGKGASS